LSEQVVVRLSRELREAVEIAASNERRNPSQLIRIWIEDAVGRYTAAQAA